MNTCETARHTTQKHDSGPNCTLNLNQPQTRNPKLLHLPPTLFLVRFLPVAAVDYDAPLLPLLHTYRQQQQQQEA
jgi:hypothetical protein